MSNMSYCRFENTEQDLGECYDNWDDPIFSAIEQEARVGVFELCKSIVEECEI